MSSRRAIVEAPPPVVTPRRAVVVKTGSRRTGGSLADTLTGILGAIILLAAVLLVNILPEDEVIEPQYRIGFGASFYPDELRGETAFSTMDTDDLGAGGIVPPGVYQFPFEVGNDNMHQIEFNVVMTDDVVASDPDTYTIRLIGPNGTVYPYRDGQVFASQPSVADPDSTPVIPSYINPSSVTTATVNLFAKPEDLFVTADPPEASLDDIQAAAQDAYSIPTAGQWIIEVELIEAGDCPPVQPNPGADNARAVRCLEGNNNSATDAGNRISVTIDKYFFYTIEAREP